jgi:hypothetical protein
MQAIKPWLLLIVLVGLPGCEEASVSRLRTDSRPVASVVPPPPPPLRRTPPAANKPATAPNARAIEDKALRTWVACVRDHERRLASSSAAAPDAVAASVIAKCSRQQVAYEAAIKDLGVRKISPEFYRLMNDKIAGDVRDLRGQRALRSTLQASDAKPDPGRGEHP